MQQPQINWLEFWYEALNSPFGIVVAVSDIEAGKQRLYQARAKSGDPALSAIQIRVSPVSPLEELWLVRQHPEKKEEPDGEKILSPSREEGCDPL